MPASGVWGQAGEGGSRRRRRRGRRDGCGWGGGSWWWCPRPSAFFFSFSGAGARLWLRDGRGRRRVQCHVRLASGSPSRRTRGARGGFSSPGPAPDLAPAVLRVVTGGATAAGSDLLLRPGRPLSKDRVGTGGKTASSPPVLGDGGLVFDSPLRSVGAPLPPVTRGSLLVLLGRRRPAPPPFASLGDGFEGRLGSFSKARKEDICGLTFGGTRSVPHGL